jgi:hypothetical protein
MNASRVPVIDDQVNVVLADRPWRALSPASEPVEGKLTWK